MYSSLGGIETTIMLTCRSIILISEVAIMLCACGLYHRPAFGSGNTEDEYVSNYGEYIGCFSQGCLQSEMDIDFKSTSMNSPDNCAHACLHSGYIYAGLYFSSCSCSCNGICTEKPFANKYCGLPCLGNMAKYCGGVNRTSIYKVYTKNDTALCVLTNTTTSTINNCHQSDAKNGVPPFLQGCLVGISSMAVLMVLVLIIKRSNSRKRPAMTLPGGELTLPGDGKVPTNGYSVRGVEHCKQEAGTDMMAQNPVLRSSGNELGEDHDYVYPDDIHNKWESSPQYLYNTNATRGNPLCHTYHFT